MQSPFSSRYTATKNSMQNPSSPPPLTPASTHSLTPTFIDAITAGEIHLQQSTSLRQEFGVLSLFYDCPSIVRCFGEDLSFDEDNNMLYHLKLEYAPGGTLQDLITENGGSLSEPEVKRYTCMIVQGLCCLHQCSVVHCDLKPANILVFPDDEDGMSTVKIADLGLAKFSSDPHSRSHSNYKFYGTPLFMSPESVRNGDIRTALDIWSLGCVVTVMLTGKRPWDVHGKEALMNVIAFGSRTPEIPKNLSKEGKDFLEKCFCRDPDKRWTAEMLLHHPFIQDDTEEYKCQHEELCGEVKNALGVDENRGLKPSSPLILLPPPVFENYFDHEESDDKCKLEGLCDSVLSALGFVEVPQNAGLMPSPAKLLPPPGFENQPRRPCPTLLPPPGFENQPRRPRPTLLPPPGFENQPRRPLVC